MNNIVNIEYQEILKRFDKYSGYTKYVTNNCLAHEENKNKEIRDKRYLRSKLFLFIAIVLFSSYYLNYLEIATGFIVFFVFMTILHHFLDDILEVNETLYNIIRFVMLCILVVITSVIYYKLTGNMKLNLFFYGFMLGGIVSIVVAQKDTAISL